MVKKLHFEYMILLLLLLLSSSSSLSCAVSLIGFMAVAPAYKQKQIELESKSFETSRKELDILCAYSTQEYRFQLTRSLKAWVCDHFLSGVAVSNPARSHGYLSLVFVVCCQVAFSASGWSLVQGSPLEFGVSKLIMKPQYWGGPRSLGGGGLLYQGGR